MKKIYLILVLSIACTLSFTSCNEELGPSIFDTSPIERTKFDYWLLEHFVKPFNVRIMYRFEDMESDLTLNLTPAYLGTSKKMAQIIQHAALEAYIEVVDSAFVRYNFPRIMQLIGSPALIPATGSSIGGTAEGGLKVTLYNVNGLQMTVNSLIGTPTSIGYLWIIHHEFAHVLHQKVMYDLSFREITPAYVGQGWMQYTHTQALQAGSVTPYSRSFADEDFVELFTAYILTDAATWESWMQTAAIVPPDTPPGTINGRVAIEQKLEILKRYMWTVWGLDMDKMREVSLRRAHEAVTMDFLTFDEE